MDRAATNRKALVWVLVALAVFEGGWLLFDGSRALVTGDYVTPESGEYAGQLGPWAAAVSSVGIEPRSTFMKLVHVTLGAAWLLAAVGLAGRKPWARKAMMTCAVLSLWYLPFGTVFGVVQLLTLARLPGTFSSQN
jgi:hypothetical protein